MYNKSTNVNDYFIWFWQMANRVITKLNEFFCDSPCYNLIGCGNVALYAALRQPAISC